MLKKTVPIITQKVSGNSYWVKSILVGIRQSAEKRDFMLDFIDNVDDIRISSYKRGSSIIVVGYAADWLKNTLDALIKKGFAPIIVNGWLSPSMLRICNGVYFQLGEAIEQSIQYLTLAGRKRIALFGTNEYSLADRFKEETYEIAIRNGKLNNDSLIFRGSNPLCGCVDEFIDSFVKNEIDAVICANDTVALYLINRMVKSGFNIPDDLYVIGMGNSCLAQKSSIPISSIDFDYEELGHRALHLWASIRQNCVNVHAEITIPCKFISRQSTDDFVCSELMIADEQIDETCIDNNIDEYYEDEDIQKIIKFENFLNTCDDMDYLVIREMMQGRSDSKMADSLNMSDRAIRYRINKMVKKLGVQTREEIVNMVRDLNAFE
jgi:DNA-binding LacI/PurR family transcriptional regulator